MKHKLYFFGYLIFVVFYTISCGQKENSNQQLQKDLKTEIQHTFVSESISSEKQNALPVIDVTKKYPEKEIYIQDIADVTYIPLETRDSFPFHGSIVAVHDDKIIAVNFQGGDIFVFSTDGKIERVINKLGNGPKEYSEISKVVYDSENNEIFVLNIRRGRITVFDINGDFKRQLRRLPNILYSDMIGFKNELIICNPSEQNDSSTFFTVSKKNGDFIKIIGPGFKKRITSRIRTEIAENQSASVNFYYDKTIIAHDGVILNEISSDTIFKYTSGNKLTPLIHRKPSVHSTDPPILFALESETDKYIFLYGIKKSLDEIRWNKDQSGGGTFDLLKFMYDKAESKTYTPIIYNSDYSVKKEVDLGTALNYGEFLKSIQAYNLVESYNKGELKGQLKEIASQLDINDNPVLMFIKFNTY